MNNAHTAHTFRAFFLILCMPSALYSAAFPEQVKQRVKVKADIIEEAIAFDVSAQAETYPHLISLLSDLRGGGDNPIQVLVKFHDEDDNSGYHFRLGGFASHKLSPLLFVMSKKYEEATCVIAHVFPDYLQTVDMLGRTPVDYYFDLFALEPQREISRSDRNLWDLFKPIWGTREGGHKALCSARTPETVVALYLRGARLDADIFRQRLEKEGCRSETPSLDDDRWRSLADRIALLHVLGEESATVAYIRKLSGFDSTQESSAALDAHIAAYAPTALSIIEAECAYLPTCQDVGCSY